MKADHGVEDEQSQDDEQVGPVAQDARKEGGDHDHDENGAPEIGQEFKEEVRLFLGELVRAVALEPAFGLVAGETLGRGVEAGEDFR
jgi:hypothetical protein